jgi:peptidoglycan/LPS O-acetylase OafA/YrhL
LSEAKKIDALTGLRAVAAWWVVLYHFKSFLAPWIPDQLEWLLRRGNLAVDLFFCLSGFVLFLNHAADETWRPVKMWRFYGKRWARIYPLHLAMLLAYLALVIVILASHRTVSAERFSAGGFLLNLILVQDWATTQQLTWNIPAWSISSEFAAYLAFPLIAYVVIRCSTPMRLAMAAGALGLLNLVYSRVDFDLGQAIASFGVIRCVTQFAVGAVLASIFIARPALCRSLRPYLYLASAVLVTVGLYAVNSLLIPAGWACLILALASGDGRFSPLRNRWIVFAGEVSYATYIVHYFCYDLFKLAFVKAGVPTPLIYVVGAFAAIWLASVLLHRAIELPCQRALQKAFAFTSVKVA